MPPPSWCIVQDPMRLISGGDDGSARVWSLHQERSVMTIDGRANVCRYSRQYGPWPYTTLKYAH